MLIYITQHGRHLLLIVDVLNFLETRHRDMDKVMEALRDAAFQDL